MGKKSIFLLAFCTLFCSIVASAQEDITNTYIQNADLSTVDNGWTYYSDAYKYTDWKTDGDVPVVEFYSLWNSGTPVSITQKNFMLSQTVTLPAGDYRLALNAFYRNGNGDGTNTDKAWIFVNGGGIYKKQNVKALTSAGIASYNGRNDLYKAANAFSNGDFSNEIEFTLDKETDVAIGFQGFFDLSLSWSVLGPIKLYKIDDGLSDGIQTVAYAIEEGKSFISGQTVAVNDDNGKTVATLIFGEDGGANFSSAVADSHVDGFTAYTSGNGTNGNKTGGTFYTIIPEYDGAIQIAVVLTAAKSFYVLEDDFALDSYNGIDKDEKYYGTFTFN